MKKTKQLMLVSAIVLAAGIITACGGSNGGNSSVVNNAVKAAEEAVEAESSPVLGMIPTLQQQYSEARSQLKNHFKEAEKSLEDKFKDGGKMEDAIRELAKLEDERKAAEQELKQLYKEKLMAEASVVAEKAVSVEYDENQYSAANAKLVVNPDSDIHRPVLINVELTLATPLFSRGYVAYCIWEYQDADKKALSEGAQEVKDFKSLQAGDKLPIKLMPIFKQPADAWKFDHLYFKKAN